MRLLNFVFGQLHRIAHGKQVSEKVPAASPSWPRQDKGAGILASFILCVASPLCMEPESALRNCVQDLRDYLRKGISLDELWKVAHGEIKYADFVGGQRASKQGPQAQSAHVPDDLVGPMRRPTQPDSVMRGCMPP